MIICIKLQNAKYMTTCPSIMKKIVCPENKVKPFSHNYIIIIIFIK